ncbi:hypothetical protein [Chamaesiphon sp. GL140_3_metabinner_50]|uniref:hypothetical protein n=1 Tax=Chamaesiphon sp. GL140_3_metabinner_50 TaxID=2970812 RepID=UPI0025D47215|nr:hypothetical protein [Chamaesiphon sp. GL140_3_metabinner_50]
MKSASGDKPQSDKKVSLNWLKWTAICLSIGSIVAVKMLFVVDKDLEISTKVGGNSWKLNSQSIRVAATNVKNFTAQHINPQLKILNQQSHQLFTQTSDTITARRDWCISKSQVSTALDKVKSLNPLEADRDIQSKDSYSNATKKLSKPTQPKTQPARIDNWCVTTGVAK